MARRRLQRVELLGLPGADAGVPHQVGHAGDGVQWRADLVRHVGQEHRLGHAGGFGRLLGRGQLRRALADLRLELAAVALELGLHLLARAHVAQHGRHQRVVLHQQRAQAQFQREAAAVGTPAAPLQLAAAAGGGQAQQAVAPAGRAARLVVQQGQLVQALAGQLVTRLTEQPFGLRIGAHDGAFGVHQQHGVGRAFEHGHHLPLRRLGTLARHRRRMQRA